MRRASSFTSSVLSRTLSIVHDGGATNLHPHFLRVALFCSSRTNNSYTHRRWFSTVSSFSKSSVQAVSLGLAGFVASVATAASVYAKEPPPAELVPKDVVLYQYEACPFCNKVKASDAMVRLFFGDRKVTDSSSGNSLFAKSRGKAAYNKRPSLNSRKTGSLDTGICHFLKEKQIVWIRNILGLL